MQYKSIQPSFKLKICYQYDLLYDNFFKIMRILKLLSFVEVARLAFNILSASDGLFYDKFILLFENEIFKDRIYLLLLIYFGIKIIAYVFHKYIGVWMKLAAEEDQSELIAYNILPNALSILGARRSGKDTLSTWWGVICSKFMKLDLIDKNEDVSKYLYMFDLSELETFINDHPDFFEIASIRLRKRKLFNHLKDVNYIESYYHDKFNISELISDYSLFMKDATFRDAIYTISDSINTKHLLDALYEYLYNYYRVHIVKAFIVSNQPIVDSEDNSALIFSQEFKRFKNHNKQINIAVPGESRKVPFKYISKLPLEDYMLSIQTEQDINKSNVDKNVTQEIKATGERVFDALRGQVAGENYREVKNGQVKGRENKLTRDLNEAEIIIIRKVYKVEAGPIRRYFLVKYNNKLERKIKRFKKDCNKKDKLINKSIRALNTIAKLKMNGYLRQETIVSSTEYFGKAEPVKKRKILENKFPLFMESYKIEFVMRMRDTWGHNDTRYMSELSDKLKEQSSVSINQVARWGKRLKLNRENIINLDNPVMDEFAKIDPLETEHKRIERA